MRNEAAPIGYIPPLGANEKVVDWQLPEPQQPAKLDARQPFPIPKPQRRRGTEIGEMLGGPVHVDMGRR